MISGGKGGVSGGEGGGLTDTASDTNALWDICGVSFRYLLGRIILSAFSCAASKKVAQFSARMRPEEKCNTLWILDNQS